MRKIIYVMKEIRKGQLNDAGASAERIQECDDLFGFLDTEMSGIKPTSTNEKLHEVMTSADFTYAIQEFVQRKALPGYEKKNFAFEPLVKPDTLPNYLPVTRYQDRHSLDDLEYVGEKGQARPGSRHDATKRQWQVYRWEKQYDFSHEALVNDDIGYFEDQAEKMGRAARRSIEKFVSRMYTNATSITALTTLGAMYSQNGRLTSTRISECRMAYNQRVDASGNPINASLRYLVYHSGLADTVLQIQNSELVPETAVNAANVVRNTFMPIEDPYITGTGANLPWWGFPDWKANNVVPFVLARRDGVPGPLIIRKRSDMEAVTAMLGAGAPVDPIWGDFDTGNVVLKVVDVWGTYVGGTGNGNYVDTRGGYYSSGTAV